MNAQSVLIVDDNDIASREMENILKYLGYENTHRSTGANEAWEMMRLIEFDIIISAWEMPDMTGLSLLRIVRNDDRFASLPFCLTHSAFTKAKVIQAGHSAATGLIVRPYEVDNISKKLKLIFSAPEDTQLKDKKAALEEGLRYIKSGQYKRALEVFETLTQSEETAEQYYNIGYVKTVQEKYDEALSAFRKATELDRLFAKAYKAMGKIYSQMGDNKKAEQCLQKAADIYMSGDKFKNAEEIINEILEINPDTVNVYNTLGVIARKKGDLKKALLNYHKALRVHPKEPNIHYNIGRLCLELNDRHGAKKYFTLAVKFKPDFKEAIDVLEAFKKGSI